MKKTFKETYRIKYEYKNEEGFYIKHEEEISIDVHKSWGPNCMSTEVNNIVRKRNLKELNILSTVWVSWD